MTRRIATLDANEAVAYTAYKINEVVAIYPITPASPMGEWADQWAAEGKPNLWGTVPLIVEMQSEGGASGAAHGALQAGSLTTTFTASQGLLLMIPNLYKIAGELTSTVFHIATRTVASHALSIFSDHSDIMATRPTGWAILMSNSVQEAHDMALIAQAATLKARVPFIHAFDGFRTSHEINKIELLSDEDMAAMIDQDLVRAHRERALSPDHPFIRGTAQNPDAFFQSRERINPYYLAAPDIVQEAMDKFADIVGRQYHLFDYVGAPDAERVVILMGSGAEAAEETVDYLVSQGEKVGVLKVHLFRPFSVKHFVQALPPTVRVIATLDRTKEPGAAGEPLYQDAITALNEGITQGIAPFAKMPTVIGGRYGLSSKEFNPAMIKGIFDEMTKERPKNHFTVGIIDDVTYTSIDYDPNFIIEPKDVTRAVFWGLGSDGTVSANKNSIKIIGEETPYYAQGYFVYDSKKAGARTTSHLRFGPRPIKSTYLIQKANFVAVHQFGFLDRYDVILDMAEPGATFLLNAPFGPDEVWDQLPREVQKQIIEKQLKFYVIDAYDLAKKLGLGVRINTIMQTCFFAISGILPLEEAIAHIKNAIRKTYGKRGEAVVRMNFAAVDAALEHLHEVKYPNKVTSTRTRPPVVPSKAPEFVREITAPMIALRGDELPVSAMPADGTWPSGTTQWEKRNISLDIPIWEPDLCIQCGKCVMVCPHAVIRAKVVEPDLLRDSPPTFKYMDARFREFKGQDMKYTIQVSAEDCTGCTLCVEICPAKDKSNPSRKALNMGAKLPVLEESRENWEFFLTLPEVPRHNGLKFNTVKNVQLLEPLFEFSGACAGCGETPYLRLMSQLFGDRAIVANATGCSSIYGGNLPTTPWSYNKEGRGPAWSNSLFEDNAEFGLGMRLTLDKHVEYARELVDRLRGVIGNDLAEALLTADQSEEAGIAAQRERVAELKKRLKGCQDPACRDLLSLADVLVKRSVWIVGGDGWAYDIGYGGLDHVLASGRNVNILVLDTEVYSNTGGQASKATPLGAVAKFAAGGKPRPKKDLGLMAMAYGNVYVAEVAMGANDTHTLRAFLEAEAYEGPSLIIAYSHCIAHGIDMAKGMEQQKRAVESGYWPLYRFNPALIAKGKNPLSLDSKAPKIPLSEYMERETRYRVLKRTHPETFERLAKEAQKHVIDRWRRLERMVHVWEPLPSEERVGV